MARTLKIAVGSIALAVVGTTAGGTVSAASAAQAPTNTAPAAQQTVPSLAAAAAKPKYTPAQICGKGYRNAKDGFRFAVRTSWPQLPYGDYAQLMYNRKTGKNCLAVVKVYNAGKSTKVTGRLRGSGQRWKSDTGKKWYAEVHVAARGKCVRFDGAFYDARGKKIGVVARSWGNCD